MKACELNAKGVPFWNPSQETTYYYMERAQKLTWTLLIRRLYFVCASIVELLKVSKGAKIYLVVHTEESNFRQCFLMHVCKTRLLQYFSLSTFLKALLNLACAPPTRWHIKNHNLPTRSVGSSTWSYTICTHQWQLSRARPAPNSRWSCFLKNIMALPSPPTIPRSPVW